MAEIIIRGKPAKLSKKEVEEIVEFYSKKLLKRISKNLYIEVLFISNFLNSEDRYGEMSYTDYDSYLPRDFEILLDARLPKDKLIKTIAHEMVHVKQYAKGQLRDMVRVPKKKFLNEFYDDDLDYFERPWEKEAADLEDILYEDWMNYAKDKNESKN